MIKDLFNRAVKLTGLGKAQTDHPDVARLKNEFDDHPTNGLTPVKLAAILREAEQGNLMAQSALAEDMEEKDGHIFSELQKRRRAVLGVPFQIVAPKDATAQEKEDAELVQEQLEAATWFDDLTFDLTDAILKSFSCTELEWGQRSDGLWLPTGYDHKPATWFQTHPEDRNELRLRNGSHEGEPFQPFGWVNHISKAKSGYLDRAALARVLAWPYLFKNYSVRDLAEFLEIYGLPLRLGKYPSGASKGEKAALLRAVMSMGHNAGGIIPRGMDIDFHEAAKGTSDPYQAMMAWAEKTQSKAILGGTLTSQADGKTSTNALGSVHNEVRQELRDADLKQLAQTLTRDLVFPLYALNCKSYRSAERHPRLTFDVTEPEDLTQYADSLPKLVGIGLKIPTEWAYEKLQIPVPADGDEVLAVPGQQPPPDPAADSMTEPAEKVKPAALTAHPASGLAVLREQVLPPDEAAMEHALQNIQTGELNGQMTAMLKPVFDALNDDPESVPAKLAELFPQLDDSGLQEMLARVMFVGEVWGRLNADD